VTSTFWRLCSFLGSVRISDLEKRWQVIVKERRGEERRGVGRGGERWYI
jgi:hypothetical protein